MTYTNYIEETNLKLVTKRTGIMFFLEILYSFLDYEMKYVENDVHEAVLRAGWAKGGKAKYWGYDVWFLSEKPPHPYDVIRLFYPTEQEFSYFQKKYGYSDEDHLKNKEKYAPKEF